MGTVLSGLDCLTEEQSLDLIGSTVFNVAGREVGEIRPHKEFHAQLLSLMDPKFGGLI